jgi:hypothetical protein
VSKGLSFLCAVSGMYAWAGSQPSTSNISTTVSPKCRRRNVSQPQADAANIKWHARALLSLSPFLTFKTPTMVLTQHTKPTETIS